MRLLPALVAAAALTAVTSGAAISTALAANADAGTCPATFTVLHNDRIGALKLAAGPYKVTLLDGSQITCAGASRRLAAFLQDFDGKLPNGWTVDPATATFTRDSDGFSIMPAATPPPAPSGGTVFPAGSRCPGTFRVMHNDRIGALRLPAGRYRITLRPSGRPSCASASRRLARFLDDPSGRLPAPWSVNPATGAFSGAHGAGFRIKPVGIVA